MFGVLIICITSDLRKSLSVMSFTFQSGARPATRGLLIQQVMISSRS